MRHNRLMAKKGSIFDMIIPAALTLAGQPELAAGYTGIKTGIQTGNPLRGLEAAGLSYGGTQIGAGIGDAVGGSLGTVGQQIGTTGADLGAKIGSSGVGNLFGASTSNAIGNTIANAGVGSLLGGYAGNSIASDMMPAYSPKMQGPSPFTPKQQDQQETPGSLAGLSAFSPEQQSSNIATQGVYGGGNGPQEQSYFTNLINRRLVDQSGGVGDLSKLSPVESSYLSQLGLGGYQSSNDLLQALTKWKPN